MITNDRLFELKLEDYSRPRYLPAIKSYFGTMEEIIQMMLRMERNPKVATRYKETLEAAEYYDLDNDVTHTVAGQTVPILTPAKELSRLETSIHKKTWTYKTDDGNLYPCYASQIDVRQSLIQTEKGYEHCIQANITDLEVCYPVVGWTWVDLNIKGFPGMVTLRDRTHQMGLATTQRHYDFDQLEAAIKDATNPNTIDFNFLVADILAEG